MRLHPAIRKWNIVVSSYDYNASRTSLQTIVILNAKSGNHIKTLLFRQFARLYHEILHPKHPLGRDDMQSNGKFGREIDLVEPKAAMRKFDRDMYDYPFDEQERHRTGESTFFDDVLYNIIFKDIGDVRICTLITIYTRVGDCSQ